MSAIPEAIDIFKRRRDFYKSIDIKIAAINSENTWHNVITRVLLSSSKPTNQTKREIDVGNFVVLHQSISADNFPILLETLEQDNFAVDRVKISFFSGTQHDFSFDNWHSNNSERAEESFNIDWPLDVFKWQVNQKIQNLSRILHEANSRLNCYSSPYEDVSKAVGESLGLHESLFREYEAGQYSTCYILLPNYLSIGNCKLRGSQLDYEMRFHSSINPRSIRLNIVVEGKTVNRRQISLKRRERMLHSGNFRSVKSRLSLPEALGVHLYPFIKGRENEGPSEKQYVRNLLSTANPRFAANEIFGANAERLEERLSGLGRQRSPDFEHAITTLFHICGFSSEWLDRGNLVEDAPDVLIFCSEPQALIVGECKTDVFSWKEMRIAVDRAQELFHELKIDTYPAMFTSVEVDDIEETVKTRALQERVTIIGAQEIDGILKMALGGNEPHEVLTRYFPYYLKYPPS